MIALFHFKDIKEGDRFQHEYRITPEVYDHFLLTFEDRSPIHVDADYAKKAGFEGRVMHGAILNGFVSHFIGTIFPGQSALLLSVNLFYLTPNYLGDSLRLDVEVTHKLESEKVLSLKLYFENLTRKEKAAKGQVQVKVRDER